MLVRHVLFHPTAKKFNVTDAPLRRQRTSEVNGRLLRRRGLVHSHELKLAPHLEGLQASGVEYEWLDERPLPE